MPPIAWPQHIHGGAWLPNSHGMDGTQASIEPINVPATLQRCRCSSRVRGGSTLTINSFYILQVIQLFAPFSVHTWLCICVWQHKVELIMQMKPKAQNKHKNGFLKYPILTKEVLVPLKVFGEWCKVSCTDCEWFDVYCASPAVSWGFTCINEILDTELERNKNDITHLEMTLRKYKMAHEVYCAWSTLDPMT